MTNLTKLVNRLTPRLKQSLENAVGEALKRHSRTVEIEHWQSGFSIIDYIYAKKVANAIVKVVNLRWDWAEGLDHCTLQISLDIEVAK